MVKMLLKKDMIQLLKDYQGNNYNIHDSFSLMEIATSHMPPSRKLSELVLAVSTGCICNYCRPFNVFFNNWRVKRASLWSCQRELEIYIYIYTSKNYHCACAEPIAKRQQTHFNVDKQKLIL